MPPSGPPKAAPFSPTSITPVAEPGMTGYTGPTETQANTIGKIYGQTGNYGQAVAQTMGTRSPSPLDTDPRVAAALAAEQLGIPAINADRDSRIAQRIAAYGDPHLADMAGFGLDPQAAAFARQNYLSGNGELARIDKSHNLARQAIINRLAGRGLLYSGDTGYLSGQEDQQYGNTVYDAQQKVLADILGLRQAALEKSKGLHDSTVAAYGAAYDYALEHPELFAGSKDKATGGTPPVDSTPYTTRNPVATNLLTKALAGRALAVRSQGLNKKYGLNAVVDSYSTGRKAFG
jgi:hypothetical protein